MTYQYDKERELIIDALSKEIAGLAREIEKERKSNGFTAQYRALSKTYNDMSKHYLSLVKEGEAETEAVDTLNDFNKPPVHDERGILAK